MKNILLTILGLGLSVNWASAQVDNLSWERRLENEICQCAEKNIEPKSTTPEQLKQIILDCFMQSGPRYEAKMTETAAAEDLSPADIGRRIGESLAKNCPMVSKLSAKFKTDYEGAGNQSEKAEKLIEEGKYAEAEQLLSKLLQTFGTDDGLYNLRGISRDAQGMFWAAAADFHRAHELDGKNAVYAYNMGQLLANNEVYNDALPYLKTSLSLNKEDDDTWLYLGYTHYGLEQYDSASYYLLRLNQLNPKNIKGLNWLGLTQQKLEQYAKAEESFRQAIKADPDFASPYYNLAELYYELEDTDKARQILNQYSGYDIDIIRLQAIYARNANEHKQSIAYLDKLKKEDTQSGDLYYLAYSHQELGNTKTALTYYQQTLPLRPEDSDVYYGLAKVLLQLKEYKQARQTLTNLIELEPNDAYNYDLEAEYYEAVNKPELALQSLIKSAELYPDDAQVYINQGRILLSLKRKPEACSAFNKAAELDADLAAEQLAKHCK